jgi:hypothetical protein
MVNGLAASAGVGRKNKDTAVIDWIIKIKDKADSSMVGNIFLAGIFLNIN